MQTIVIDARESGTTTGRYVDKLIENLQSVDKLNNYIILAKSSRINEINIKNNKFKIIRCDVKEFSFGEQTYLLKQINSFNPDLVHFPMVQHPILYRNKKVVGMLDLTTLRFKNPSKNFIVFWFKQRLYWVVNYVAASNADAVITISNFVKNDILNHFKIKPDKITVTYNSADMIIDKSEPVNNLLNKKFIMYVGRHQPHKNLDRLIEAHQKLLEKNPNLVLAIAGKKDAVTEILENKIKEKDYKNVLFTGFVSEGQLRWMYENCEAYIFPSLSEGFGLPGLEAMVHGAPVISSSATCLPEVYGDAAVYFDPLNVDDMSDKINSVINSSELKKDLVAKGKTQASKYSWQRMAEQTLAVYKKVLDS